VESTTATDNWHVEDAVMAAARERGRSADVAQPSPTLGALLRTLTSAMAAQAVVQVGADSGMSGLYLLNGMPEDAVLTSIESVPTQDRLAREAFRLAEVGHRARSITGDPLEVCSRLTDGAYDIVVIGAAVGDRESFLEQARRLVKGGGTAVFLGVFGPDDAVLDQARRDDVTTAARRFLDEAMEDPELRCALLPLDHGTLIVEID